MKMKKWKSKIRKIGNHANENKKKEETVSQDSTNQFTDELALNLEVVRKELGHN